MQPTHAAIREEPLPEGMLAFESTVLRTMRRAKLRAADHERARIVAWIRQQKAASWPDLRDLAAAIKQGEAPPAQARRKCLCDGPLRR
jgi:hypothetical protein